MELLQSSALVIKCSSNLIQIGKITEFNSCIIIGICSLWSQIHNVFKLRNWRIFDVHDDQLEFFDCSLMNTIKPGSIKKINQNNMAFKMMENIENFLKAAENYGCKKIDLFQVVDLYERQNMTQVVNGIYALGRVVSLWYIP